MGKKQKLDESVGLFDENKIALYKIIFPDEDVNSILQILVEMISPRIRSYIRGIELSNIEMFIQTVEEIEMGLMDNKEMNKMRISSIQDRRFCEFGGKKYENGKSLLNIYYLATRVLENLSLFFLINKCAGERSFH